MKSVLTSVLTLGALSVVSACGQSFANSPTEAAAPPPAEYTPQAAPDVSMPFESFTLDNGLRVIVHEDRKAPIVAVSVWYGVGSKDEPPGKTGFAHLFEHLMFNGSENFDDDYFIPFEEVGATGMNGTTWFDRTNYFQTVPTPALDMALWMESDRMGHFLGAVDQEKLEEQRGVVLNEKSQGDNNPYGMVQYRVLEGVFPAGHPYRHTTIGSVEDIEAATLEDARQWFEDFYGPNNAVLVLAGDIDTQTAREKVETYFGDIEPGPPLAFRQAWVPERAETLEEIMYDRAPQPRLYRVWATPGLNERASMDLALAGSILGSGKTSRLYRRLVHEEELATAASVYNMRLLLSSMFYVDVRLRPDADRERVKAIIDEELERFMRDGPTADELKRIKTRIYSSTVRGLERIGGFGGKAVTLAEGALYSNDPAFYQTELDWIANATPASVRAAAREWLSKGHYRLDVLPIGQPAATTAGVDRSNGPPLPDTTPDLTWPDVQTARLSNGMDVVFARRDAVPVVDMSIVFDAGYAADAGGKLGVSSFAASLMDEGTTTRDTFQIAEDTERLGASIGVSTGLDTTTVGVSALKSNLDASVALMADILKNPTFQDDEIERVRARWIANIDQEKASPVNLALRILPPIIYGEGHAYAIPFTGSGTGESVAAITREDLVEFHRAWIRPEKGQVFVVGDTTLEEILAVLERHIGAWTQAGDPGPDKNIAEVDRASEPTIILVDKPAAVQTLILAAHTSAPGGDPDSVAIAAMNDILGGQFTARVNMNLREDKGWSYGAFTFFQGAVGQRPFMAYAPVQADKTAEAILEMKGELDRFLTTEPPTAEELDRVVKNNVRSLPGAYETAGSVLSSLRGSALYGRPFDRPLQLKAEYDALTPESVLAAARRTVSPESLSWVIVGDFDEIEDQVRSLDFAQIEVRDLDGNLVQ